MSVKRIDRGEYRRPEKQANGWLRVDGLLTRVGVFTYRNPDGTERKEFRPPEEVFNADSLASFDLVPLTDDHPPVPLDASNTSEYQKGTVSAPRADGEYVASNILVTSGDTIEKMSSGKRELSCGYTCDLDAIPGEWNGIRYDAVQRNIRGNHVALVTRGRAGAEARIRMDAEAACMVAEETNHSNEVKTVKYTIDGADFEVAETVAQAFDKASAQAKAELDKATARADSLETELKEAKASLEAAPAKVRAELSARATLETNARKVLGGEFKADGLSDSEIKAAVIAKVSPETSLDGKSADYVNARFDFAIEASAKRDEPEIVVRVDAATIPGADPVAAAKAKYFETLNKQIQPK